MADILTLAADRPGFPGPIKFKHPLTDELLTGAAVPGVPDRDQVTLSLDTRLTSPFTFTCLLGGQVFTFVRDIVYPAAPVEPIPPALNDARISYAVPAGTETTSAGVYQIKKGVETLVRTLWSAKSESGATGTDVWDGRLDDLSVAPAGTYSIKVLSHAMSYKWEGVFGNSSFKSSHVTSGNFAGVRKGFSFLKSVVQVGDWFHASKGYEEGLSPMEKWHKDSPDVSINIFPYGYANGGHAGLVAADDTLVYTAYQDAIGSRDTWVSAYNASTSVAWTFSGGVTLSTENAKNFPMSACGRLAASTTAKVIGLAVQKTGDFLFVCHGGRLDILNKRTGVLVASNTSFTNPRQVTVDGSGIWLTTGANTVARYTVNADGSLSAATFTLSGPSKPLALAMKPDGSAVVVGDGDPARQQYIAYSTSTSAVLWSIAQAGGYYNTVDVVDNRVYLTDVSGSINHAFACFTSDGGIYVGDPGNFRLLRFDSSRTYVDQICYLPATYCSAIDANNSKRQFHDYLEFDVNTDNPIETRGKLVRNWRCTVPAKFFGFFNPEQNVESFGVLSSLNTLSNGRTYGTLKRYSDEAGTSDSPDNRQVLVELAAGGFRFIPVGLPEGYTMGQDGGIYWTTLDNRVYTHRMRPLTGFNAAGDPVHGTAIKLTAGITVSDLDPVDFSGSSFSNAHQKTKSGKYVSFFPNILQVFDRGKPTQKAFGYGWRGGLTPANGDAFSALFARTTSGVNYIGDYPKDGAFDNGNHSFFAEGYQKGYAGSNLWVLDDETFWGYYGEFRKDAQENKWQHGHENGLHVATWGPSGIGVAGTDGRAGMAGGVHIGNFFRHKTDSDKAYLMHSGENGFNGLHSWLLSGRNTIKVETVATIKVVEGKPFAAVATDWVDIFSTFPYASNPYASPAFAKDYTEVVYVNPDPDTGNERRLLLGVRTNLRTYDRFKSPGVSQVLYEQRDKTARNDYFFPAVDSAGWKAKFNINYTSNQINEGFLTDANSSGVQLEILDKDNLALLRFNTLIDSSVNPNQDRFYLNGKNFASYQAYTGASAFALLDQDFLVERVASGIQLSYANIAPAIATAPADAGANLNKPAKLRVALWHKGTVQVRDHALHINWAKVLPAVAATPPVGSDARVAPDPATGPPNGVNWQEPITLLSSMTDADGVIRPKGHYRSTNAGVPAITLNCGSTPVDLSQMLIAHAGRGISGGTGSNLRARDISLYGLNTSVDNQTRERGIHISKGTNVDLQYITLETSGGIYCEEWVGNHTPSQSLKIQNLKTRDIIGSDGTGADGPGGYRSIVQLKDIRTKGMRLAYIEGFNRPDKSRIEDTFNLFRSGGLDADNPLLGYGLLGYGSYPFPATSDRYTGAVYSADGGYDTSRGEMPPAFMLLDELFAISNCNAAGNIAVGHDIAYRNIRAVTSGYLPDGPMLRSSFKAFSINNFYAQAPGYNNTISGITSLFYRTKDVYRRADFVADPAYDPTPDPGIDVAGAILLPDVTSAADGLAKEAALFKRWIAFLNEKNQTCGSRYKPLAP